jgi:hypothetical protein
MVMPTCALFVWHVMPGMHTHRLGQIAQMLVLSLCISHVQRPLLPFIPQQSKMARKAAFQNARQNGEKGATRKQQRP